MINRTNGLSSAWYSFSARTLGLSASALAFSSAMLPASAYAATAQVLANGNNNTGGIYYSSVLLGPGGVLYAVPTEGTNAGHGSVLQLTPPAAGKVAWKQTVLHKFAGYPTDGANPQGSVIADKAGSLYGTTTSGGANNQGVVFKLTRPAVGKTVWTKSILYSFGTVKNDTSQSRAPLVFDSKGNLYGTTIYGGGSTRCGSTGCGTVFKLTPPAAGKTKWTETILHRFGSTATDGQLPELGALVINSKGVLFGTTGNGGTHAQGTAFELTPPAAGQIVWKETILHSFGGGVGGDDGGSIGGLVMDKTGALYGAAAEGGTGFGAIYKLTPPAAGKTAWTETSLYNFQKFNDCNYPGSALIIDKTGALYGTAPDAGKVQPAPGLSDGCAFTLKLAGGKWKETVIYTFTSTPTKPPRQGATPEAALIADTHGNLYGTTNVGGAFSEGTIFKLTGSGFAE
jgi:uncharacterized repeat protein (TIGR03803 family)